MLDLNFLSVLDEKAEFLYRFSDDIWAHPETAFTEFHAAERYCAVLRSEGFAVTEGLAGIPTAFSGRRPDRAALRRRRLRPRLRSQSARHGQPRRGHRGQALSGGK